ncbi:MAG TPA: TlpA disulfide reductase family protein [Ktedonobacterales bacterium]|nr:TlpA disulfide reductase family protein [Ktedonobacterales bacterium]
MASPAEQANPTQREHPADGAQPERQPTPPTPQTPQRARSLRVVGAIGAGLVVILLAILLLSRISTANTQAHSVPPGTMGISLVGRTAPNITFTAWTEHPGQQMTLASLRGHPVVLNFWEGSCYPCQLEAPLFKQANAAYQARGVIFLGVALYTTQADGDAFIKQHDVTYLAGVTTTNQTVVDYSLIGVPDTYFINSAGQIVDQNVGQITQQKLTAGIQTAMK